MENESFEDPSVAELINQYFIPIKVDREERPDVDSIYMNVCQMLTGQGGWPLNVFLTPDQKPFYAGTYFPKSSLYGKPGMLDIIPQLYEQYQMNNEKISEIAERVTAGLREQTFIKQGEAIDEGVIHHAFEQLSEQYDDKFGGFGREPKFPMPHQLIFLLSYYAWTGKKDSLRMVEKTMKSIADGGIHDHIGGGFARYSTDHKWLVPHFEKMLYDQALLLHVIADLYLITKDLRWRKLANELFAFIEREMTSSDGAFYSAIDADSEGVEGKYYVWTYDEVVKIIGQEEGELFCSLFNITKDGNFEGKNIPNLNQTELDSVAKRKGITANELYQKIEMLKGELLGAREKRVYPHSDDKILTSWNALMIAALAKAGAAFGESHYTNAAKKAAAFIEKELWKKEGLYARYREGEVKFEGYLDDYAYMLWAYIELFETEQHICFLRKAQEITTAMFDRFWDEKGGGFYFTSSNGEELIVREKQLFDHELPSGNSVAAFQLWKLAKITGDSVLQKNVDKLLSGFSKDIIQYPHGPIYMLQVIMANYFGGREVFLSGTDDKQKDQYLNNYYGQFQPFNILVKIPTSKNGQFESWEEKFVDDRPFALFVCESYMCSTPVFSLDQALI